jgi:type I restriction enzyme S subunit
VERVGFWSSHSTHLSAQVKKVQDRKVLQEGSPLVRTEWFWTKLAEATRGGGARRERTRPEAFLKIEIPMPEYKKQEQGERLFCEIEKVTHLHAASEPALDALMPAILDRAFRGEL